MLASLLIALREGLEAALIIGIILGMLRRTEQLHLKRTVFWGIGTALLGSVLVAFLLNLIGVSLPEQWIEIFEGGMMLLAAGILTWVLIWMQEQAGVIQTKVEKAVDQAARQGSSQGIFTLAFISVFREGTELAIFLTAAAISTSTAAVVIGTSLGLLGAGILSWFIFRSIIQLDLKMFFRVTGILLILVAAGLVAHGVHEFNEAGIIPPLIAPVWDLSGLIGENTMIGNVLKALFGYNANPSLTEVFAYTAYLLIILIGSWNIFRNQGLETA